VQKDILGYPFVNGDVLVAILKTAYTFRMVKKAPKYPQNRSTEASLLIRCSGTQREYILRGAAEAERALAATTPGARLPIVAWALSALLEKAEKTLGVSFEDFAKQPTGEPVQSARAPARRARAR
jgi:hypothetical protein